MHRRNTYVANKYDGESDSATMEVAVQRPLRSKDKKTPCCQGCGDQGILGHFRWVRSCVHHLTQCIYQHVDA